MTINEIILAVLYIIILVCFVVYVYLTKKVQKLEYQLGVTGSLLKVAKRLKMLLEYPNSFDGQTVFICMYWVLLTLHQMAGDNTTQELISKYERNIGLEEVTKIRLMFEEEQENT